MKMKVLKPINILLTVLVIMLFSACGKTENSGDSISVGGFPSESEEVIDEKSDIDSLIDSLEVYGHKEPYEKLYSMSTDCENVPDLTGTWNRTNVQSFFSGEIVISDVNSSGFKFTADEYYYSHSGWMEGEAKFVTDKCAVAKYEDSVDDDEE